MGIIEENEIEEWYDEETTDSGYRKLLSTQILNAQNFNWDWKDSIWSDENSKNTEYWECWAPSYHRNKDQKVLHFIKYPADKKENFFLYNKFNAGWNQNFKPERNMKIPKTPYKVLDAPKLKNDFYWNLLDWGRNNMIVVGLASNWYLWNANNGKVSKLKELKNDYFTSLSFNTNGTTLAFGSNQGKVQIWDINKAVWIRGDFKHSGKVGVISLNNNMLISGSRDKSIIVRDIREKPWKYQKIKRHSQEIVGLKWDESGQNLASGGNDNKLFVWDIRNFSKAKCRFRGHSAAVRAISWSPHKENIVVSGGGTSDQTIRFWDIFNGKQIQCLNTSSQVWQISFSQNANQFVSTHGFSSIKENQNQVWVWKCTNSK